jgi:hypothetical protein
MGNLLPKNSRKKPPKNPGRTKKSKLNFTFYQYNRRRITEAKKENMMNKYISISGEEDKGTASLIVDGLPITPHIPIIHAFKIAREKGIQTDIIWNGNTGKWEDNMMY